uniref:SUMO specific peptidase 7b n=1 Tax=Cyprinus carpio TaxID=7962 RepID=A0A8C2E7W5_CYPCA
VGTQTLTFPGPSERLIQYPPPPSKGGITVTTEDLECLKDGEFLNDVIIDFYLKYLLLERADKDVAERSHIFSSFFYKQLTRKNTSCPEETGSTAHWYLVVICFPSLEGLECVPWRNKGPMSQDKSQTSKASSAGDCQRGTWGQILIHGSVYVRLVSDPVICLFPWFALRPCILVMDSLKLSNVTSSRRYLQVEWEVRKGSTRAFTSESISGSLCRVPLQDNSSDCGLYLLQYVESFLQNPVVHFYLPLRLEHWFPRNQVRRKREELRELVLQLYRRQGGGAEQSGK